MAKGSSKAKAGKSESSDRVPSPDESGELESAAVASRIVELEVALAREKQERLEDAERVKRANDRARDADEAYRKLQLDLVAAKDEVSSLRDEKLALEDKAHLLEDGVAFLRQEIAELKAAARSSSKPSAAEVPAPSQEAVQHEELLGRLNGLRELLSETASSLSQLHADEIALSKKRAQVLADACAILARAVGSTGQAPPPLPSAGLEARLSIAPVVDISEVAEIIESLRPPKAPGEP